MLRILVDTNRVEWSTESGILFEGSNRILILYVKDNKWNFSSLFETYHRHCHTLTPL